MLIALIAACSAAVQYKVEIRPTNATVGEKCYGDVPVSEMERIQKRVLALEARFEQFEVAESELDAALKEVESDEKKNLSPEDKSRLTKTKYMLSVRRVQNIKMMKQLLKMMKKTINILPKKFANKMLKAIKVKTRIQRLNKLALQIKIIKRCDPALKSLKNRRMAMLKRKLRDNPKEVERIVTMLAVKALTEMEKKKFENKILKLKAKK